ncbi:MAG TPA: hypothetical protein ENK91_09930 [Bacteroidetes bacterium]|nr:hypothetical protein [Arcobacter sp.]HHH53966.1 hypothetical protein [Bacteroidota bacterium]
MTLNVTEFQVKNDVLFGNNSYLFLYQGSQYQFDYLTGKKKPSTQSIRNFKNNIQNRIEYCSKHKLDYLHIVFPSKPVVKAEELPKSLSRDVHSLYLRYYKNDNTKIYYPRDDLKNKESESLTFRKLDTHNSGVGYYTIVENMMKKVFNISINQNMYEFSDITTDGELTRMLNSNQLEKHTALYYYPQNYHMVSNRKSLRGNTNDVMLTHTYQSLLGKRCLIFGDSFCKDIVPFLLPFFSDILYIRSAFFHEDIIQMYAPDFIITGNAERYLSHVKSDNEANSFLFELYGSRDYYPSLDYLEALKAQLSYRFYPHVYQSFKDKLALLLKPSLKLFHNYKLHSNIKQTHEKKLVFQTNNVGQLWLFCMDFKVGCSYRFSFEVYSSIASTFRIFYSDKELKGYPFSGERVLRYSLREGFNTFSLVCHYQTLGQLLRIDPLLSTGEIEFIVAEVQEIEKGMI